MGLLHLPSYDADFMILGLSVSYGLTLCRPPARHRGCNAVMHAFDKRVFEIHSKTEWRKPAGSQGRAVIIWIFRGALRLDAT